MSETNYAEIAELVFPAVSETPAEILARYPARLLPEKAIITRFAPSPTGFVHIGSIYISMVGRFLTRQTGGVFMLRIEDTDQERLIEGAMTQIIEALKEFNLTPDEGPVSESPLVVRGDYGPYIQSERKQIYAAFAKDLIARGLAYPSFQTPEELEAIRQEQQKKGAMPGYYGSWAQDRTLTLDAIRAKRDAGVPMVVRLRAPYPAKGTIIVQDAIRGTLELPPNDADYVLLKPDGLATYHFAHPIDDVLMRINLVLRGEEWLATLPLHVQIFEAIGQPLPLFAHIAPIGKLDGDSKRKLSKRKDPEAAVRYYYEQGYPKEAVLEYLMNIADSSFEEWRTANPRAPITDFEIRLNRMAVSIAMFDSVKLESISREIIARYSAAEVYQQMLNWAEKYDPALVPVLTADSEYTVRVFDIERGGDVPRKDLVKWSDFYRAYGFFFDPLYEKSLAGGSAMPEIAAGTIAQIMDYCLRDIQALPDKDTWLQGMRTMSEQFGFAPNRKAFKAAPDQFKGEFSDVMMIYRVGLANQRFTPDLYEMIRTMGAARASARLQRAKALALKA